jgi:phosphatidylglycerophosphatase C
MQHKELAVFDFDGTITHKDSFFRFLEYIHGRSTLFFKMFSLIPVLFSYKRGIIDNNTTKERILAAFFRNMYYDALEEKAKRYVDQIIPSLLKSSAMDKLQWHKESGHRVVLLSASLEIYLDIWAKQHDIECIATKMEVIDGKITGRYIGKNCYGEEKLKRLKEQIELQDYTCIYGYGDSLGDREFLEICDKKHYQYFVK